MAGPSAPRPRPHGALRLAGLPTGMGGQQDKIQRPGFSFLFFSIFSSAKKKKKREFCLRHATSSDGALCRGTLYSGGRGFGGRLPHLSRATGVSTSRRGPDGAGVAGGDTGRGAVWDAEGGASSFKAGSGAGVGGGFLCCPVCNGKTRKPSSRVILG